MPERKVKMFNIEIPMAVLQSGLWVSQGVGSIDKPPSRESLMSNLEELVGCCCEDTDGPYQVVWVKVSIPAYAELEVMGTVASVEPGAWDANGGT